MRILFLLLVSTASAFAQCGILVLNPTTFNLDCTGPASASLSGANVWTNTQLFNANVTSGAASNWDLSAAASVSLPALFVRTDTAFTMAAGKTGIFTPAAAFPSIQLIAGPNPTGNWAGAVNTDNSGCLNQSPSNTVWSTLCITGGKKLTVSNTMTFAGGDSSVITFPNTTTTVVTIADSATVTPAMQTASGKTFTKSIWLDTPVAGDSYRIRFEEGEAITLTRVACNVKGGTNAVINLRKVTEATSESGGTAALTSNLTCTAGAMVASTTFTSAGAATRIPVALEIASVSGTNTDLFVVVEYTKD